MRLFDPLIGPVPQQPILIEGAAKVRGGFQLLCSCIEASILTRKQYWWGWLIRLFDPLIGPALQRFILIEGAAKVRPGFQLLCSCIKRLFCLMNEGLVGRKRMRDAEEALDECCLT